MQQSCATVDIHNAIRLLQTLFGNQDAGFITIWAKNDTTRNRKTTWYRLSDPEALSKASKKAADLSASGWDAYFSTCPGREQGGPGKRISQDQVICVPALFMDCDIGKPGCPASREALIDGLLTLELPPSVVVGSGGGGHAYWVLDKAFVVNDKEELENVKVLLRGFANGIAQELGFVGFDLSASEPARVLRVPGTFNYKTDPPRLVETLHFSDTVYTLDQLLSRVPDDPDEGLEEHQPQPRPDLAGYILPGPRASSGELSDEQIKAKARNSKDGGRFSRLWLGNWKRDYGSQSEGDLALCNMLAFWTQGEPARMDSLFRQSGLMRDKWDELHGVETYGSMTIRKALDTTTTFYNPSDIQKPTTRNDFGTDPSEESPFDRFRRAFELVGGYSADKGSLWAETTDKNGNTSMKPLATFAALITEEVTRDDGAETRKEFVVEGVTRTGKTLPPAIIASAKFPGMSWPMDAWGADANIFPGQNTRDSIRFAIVEASNPHMARRTVYTHTGWRKIHGQWAYLYHGGAVGAQDVCVELSGPLARYALPPASQDPMEACAGSMSLLEALPARIGVPLLAQMYLAPLCEFMRQAGCAPTYSLYLSGTSGSGKTTAAALMLSHFGAEFNYRQLPASFSDTANATRQKAFELKDMPLLVDDYAPSTNPTERRRKVGEVDQLIRTWGDRAERGRMRADGTLKNPTPPRGLAVLTGEEVPDVTVSGMARLFVVEVKPGEVARNQTLTQAQEIARLGLPARAMRGYIEWLLPQIETLPQKLYERFIQYRGWAMEHLMASHARQPEDTACLMLGFSLALDYWQSVGALDDRSTLWDKACRIFMDHSAAQSRTLDNEQPIEMFMGVMNELLTIRKIRILPVLGSDGCFVSPDAAGYQDGEYLYLLPGVAYGAVCEHLRLQGTGFPIKQGELWKRMGYQGILQTWNGSTSKTKHIPGLNSPRVLWIPKAQADRLFKGLQDPDQCTF